MSSEIETKNHEEQPTIEEPTGKTFFNNPGSSYYNLYLEVFFSNLTLNIKLYSRFHKQL